MKVKSTLNHFVMGVVHAVHEWADCAHHILEEEVALL